MTSRKITRSYETRSTRSPTILTNSSTKPQKSWKSWIRGWETHLPHLEARYKESMTSPCGH
ncbi:hypothetical protein S40285_10811, partial [Stachybotrys chlorohalonatus IBT 40285]